MVQAYQSLGKPVVCCVCRRGDTLGSGGGMLFMPVSLRNPTPGTETPALTVGGAEELGLCSGPQGRSGAPHVRLVRSEDPVPSASTQMYNPPERLSQISREIRRHTVLAVTAHTLHSAGQGCLSSPGCDLDLILPGAFRVGLWLPGVHGGQGHCWCCLAIQ